jgi:hypothetical protein
MNKQKVRNIAAGETRKIHASVYHAFGFGVDLVKDVAPPLKTFVIYALLIMANTTRTSTNNDIVYGTHLCNFFVFYSMCNSLNIVRLLVYFVSGNIIANF